MSKDDTVVLTTQPGLEKADAAFELLVGLPEVDEVRTELHLIVGHAKGNLTGLASASLVSSSKLGLCSSQDSGCE